MPNALPFGQIVPTSTTTVKQDNTFMEAQAWTQLGVGVLGALNKILGADTPEKTQKASSNNSTNNSSPTVSSNNSTFCGRLSNSSSFNSLNSIETELKNKKTNFQSDYSKLYSASSFSEITKDCAQALQDAGVTFDFNALTLSTNINLDDIDASIKTIDEDYAKFGNFEASLPDASGKVTQKINSITSQISSLEGQISAMEKNDPDNPSLADLKQKLEDLKTQKRAMEDAKTAIGKLQTQCEEIKEDLETKKAELEDIKKFEDEVQDKKFKLAKEQDKELGKAMEKYEELQKEIAKYTTDGNGAEYDKSDDKRAEKLNKLIGKRDALAGEMNSLISSLSASGETSFTNSKGESYEITNLSAAQKLLGGSSS